MRESLDYIMSIRDPIYGLIQITELERKILKTTPVARSRWIKQMGLACLEFPGANHTRFEHSLGTMHVADILAKNLLKTGNRQIERHTRQEIRIAALLHDIGHTPFSHVVEEFFKRFPEYAPEAEQYDHEQYATMIIAQDPEIKRACSGKNIDLAFVSKLAVGKSKTFLDPLISSCLDADKIDYVVRDSYYCGLPYGNVDLLSLAESIKLTCNLGEVPKIVFEQKSRNAAEGLLTSRFYLMTTVHFNNRNCAANLLLFRAIAEAYNTVLRETEDKIAAKFVIGLLSRHMHLKWVDHDLITFLKNPLGMFSLSIMDASQDEAKEFHSEEFERNRVKVKSMKNTKSSLLVDKILKSRLPRLRQSYIPTYITPGARYGLYIISRFAGYTSYLSTLENSLRRKLSLSQRTRVYTDITFPRFPEMNTMVSSGKSQKYLYDTSLFLRSLISQSAGGLILSIYSYKKIQSQLGRVDVEDVIYNISDEIRHSFVKKRKTLSTDLILLLFYYIHQLAKKTDDEEPRYFFKADTRFQALASYILNNVLPKEHFSLPYPNLIEIVNRFPNVDRVEGYEQYREEGYPSLYNVAFVQDMDFLSELGLLYTRFGTVPILGTGEFTKRYERRISKFGRIYVNRYIKNVYPFSKKIKEQIMKLLDFSPLWDLST